MMTTANNNEQNVLICDDSITNVMILGTLLETELGIIAHQVTDPRKVIPMMDEQELQKLRAKRLQQIRKNELGLTQKSLADAIGVNLRTLQDWEIGRSPMPKPVEILINLMISSTYSTRGRH